MWERLVEFGFGAEVNSFRALLAEEPLSAGAYFTYFTYFTLGQASG